MKSVAGGAEKYEAGGEGGRGLSALFEWLLLLFTSMGRKFRIVVLSSIINRRASSAQEHIKFAMYHGRGKYHNEPHAKNPMFC